MLELPKTQPDEFAFPIENSATQPEFFPLDPRQIQLDRIGGLIFTAVAATGFIIAIAAVFANAGLGIALYGVMIGALVSLAILLYFAIFWPPKTYRHASWRLDEEGLELRRGVLWRHRISIPLGRVQHADVSQGPLQRYFEIGSLTVHTAGTQGASITLEGLTHSVALELRDRLVRQRKASDVV